MQLRNPLSSVKSIKSGGIMCQWGLHLLNTERRQNPYRFTHDRSLANWHINIAFLHALMANLCDTECGTISGTCPPCLFLSEMFSLYTQNCSEFSKTTIRCRKTTESSTKTTNGSGQTESPGHRTFFLCRQIKK
jgi:hypothetical protein